MWPLQGCLGPVHPQAWGSAWTGLSRVGRPIPGEASRGQARPCCKKRHALCFSGLLPTSVSQFVNGRGKPSGVALHRDSSGPSSAVSAAAGRGPGAGGATPATPSALVFLPRVCVTHLPLVRSTSWGSSETRTVPGRRPLAVPWSPVARPGSRPPPPPAPLPGSTRRQGACVYVDSSSSCSSFSSFCKQDGNTTCTVSLDTPRCRPYSEAAPTPEFSPGESRGQRKLGGYSRWGLRVGHD